MTTAEAIKMLRTIKRTVFLGNQKFEDALDVAISALGKDTNVPSNDTISRQDVIELVKNSYYDLAESIEDTWAMVADVEKLPSTQPEQRWIPCGERMPEEREWIGTKRFGTTISDEVYVTFEAPDGQRFADHISFQNGGLSAPDVERMRVWYKGAKPIAWMPLPEPYKGEGERDG